MATLFLGKQQQQQQQQKVVLLLLVAMMMMILFQEVSLVEAAARPLIGMRMGMGIGIGEGGEGTGRGGHNMIKMFETLGIRTCKCCMINNISPPNPNPNQQGGGGGGGIKSGSSDQEYYSCKTIYIAHMTTSADCSKLECLPWKL